MIAGKRYHWVIAFCCFLLIFCNVGLPSTSFNVYQPYIVALPGIGDSAGSIIIGVRTFVSLMCMFAVVRYYHFFDCRRGSLIACLCATVSLTLFGFAHTFPVLCLAAAIGGAAYGLGGMVCTTLLINRWFRTNVGTAIGIAAVGSGVASIVVPVCAEWVIRTYSLSLSFWCEAVIALAIAVLTFALLRDRPAQVGLEPYVSTKALAKAEVGRKAGEAEGAVPPDAGRSLSGRQRLVFVFAMACVGAACVGAPTFLSVFMVSEGHDHAFAALMLSVLGLTLTGGKFLMGWLFDAVGDLWGTFIAFTTFIAGLVLVCLGVSGSGALIWVGTLLFGFGLAIGSTGIPIWSLHLSVPEERVGTVRTFQTGYASGSFVFTLVPGILKDIVGTYLISYVIIIGLLVAAFIVILAVYARVR